MIRDRPEAPFVRPSPSVAPTRILVFGAAGQIGRPLIERLLSKTAPPFMRLATSSSEKADDLRKRFPQVEVVLADYYNLKSMIDAFAGMQAAFVISPDSLDERRAMTNVAAAVHHAGTVHHILRMTGASPGCNRVEDLLPLVRDIKTPALQFQIGREVLLACGTPVSFVNCWAALFSNLLRFSIPDLVLRNTFAIPYDRVSTHLDPADVGAAAAELLLAGHDRHHDGMWYHLTGCERIRYSEIAIILSEELGVPIAYEDDPQRFQDDMAKEPAAWGADPSALLRYMQAEVREEPIFMVSDTLPTLIGRPAKSIRQYIREHRAELRGDVGIGAEIRRNAGRARA